MIHFSAGLMLIVQKRQSGTERDLCKNAIAVFVMFLCYMVVPAFVWTLSVLVITEAGTEVDVLQDCLALEFLLQINNVFQFFLTEESSVWKIMMTKECTHIHIYTLYVYIYTYI